MLIFEFKGLKRPSNLFIPLSYADIRKKRNKHSFTLHLPKVLRESMYDLLDTGVLLVQKESNYHKHILFEVEVRIFLCYPSLDHSSCNCWLQSNSTRSTRNGRNH